jgi:hypothetical protein
MWFKIFSLLAGSILLGFTTAYILEETGAMQDTGPIGTLLAMGLYLYGLALTDDH